MEISPGMVAGIDGMSEVGDAPDGDAREAVDEDRAVRAAVVDGEMEVSLGMMAGIGDMSEVGDAPDGDVAPGPLVRDGDGDDAVATVVDEEGLSGETEGIAGLTFKN